MNPIVDPVWAGLSGLVLFFVPGLTFLAIARRSPRAPSLRTDEALFLIVAVSVMVSAWVGLVLAEAGVFRLTTAAALEVAGAAIALLLGRKRLASPVPPVERPRSFVPAAVVLVLALALQARPTEYVFGGRDPGMYVAAMALIARTGGIAVTDETVKSIPADAIEIFYRNPENPARFQGFPLELGTARVYPENFHLFPAFGAYLFQAMGTRGALATPPIFGVLGTLAVFFALRRLFSDAVAATASLLLVLNVLQVWFARYPASEILSQTLLFVGLLAVLAWEERGSRAFGLLAGAAFGLSLLVRIDSVLVLLPLAAYILLRRARRDLTWPHAAAVLVPLGLSILHGGVHAAFWSKKYVRTIVERPYWRPYLEQPLWLWIVALVVAVALVVVVDRLGPLLLRPLASRPRQVRVVASAALVLLTLYAYFLRPRLSAWAGADGAANPVAAQMFQRLDADGNDQLSAEELARAALSPADVDAMDRNRDGWLLRSEWKNGPPRASWLRGFRHLAGHDAAALVRFGWFATPVVLALALVGLLLALRNWHPRYLLFVLLVLTFALFYFYKMRVWHDAYFAMRRTTPMILPGVLGLAAFALVQAWRSGRAARTAAGALGVGVAIQYAAATWPILTWREWRPAVTLVNDLARRFGPRDVVLFEEPRSIHLFSLPLWAHHGVNVLELARLNPDPEKLQRVVEAWRNQGRNIYFVSTYRSDPYLCSLFLEHVQTLHLAAWEWERNFDGPPTRPMWYSWQFRISRVVPPQDLQVPPLPEVDIGGSDDAQVSGFFIKEGGGDLTYRWTGSCASVYFPGARAGQSLVIRAAAGQRPPAGDLPHADGSGSRVRIAPAEVQVSLAGVALGSFEARADWTEHHFRLPSPLPPGAPVLRLSVKAWRPANVLPGSTDTRDLGLMIDRVRIEPVG